jgi:hypothetical protein
MAPEQRLLAGQEMGRIEIKDVWKLNMVFRALEHHGFIFLH